MSKKYISYILLGVVLVGTLVWFLGRQASCGEELRETPHVFIVTAFETELQAVLEKVTVRSTCREDGVTYHRVEYGGKEMVIFASGIGSKEAERVTESTLTRFPVSLLVFSGVAGGTDPKVRVGDVVVPRAWVDVEQGETLEIDEDLTVQVTEASDVHVVEKGATYSVFVTSTSTVPQGVSIVDMETASIVRVAGKHNVPFIAFRGVSDMVGSASTDMDFAQSAQRSADVALEYIRTWHEE